MDIKTFVDEFYVDRKDTQSVKWDGMQEEFGENCADYLPLWIADMDFKVPNSVTEAMMKRVEHGVYGYTFITDSYLEVFKGWMKKRHNFEIETEWLRYTTGVVQGIYDVIYTFTEEDDAIIIQAPVYHPFADAIRNTGRELVEIGLKNENMTFSIDFAAFEEAIVEKNVKLYIHCSPHNPVGRVWTEEELVRLFDICEKHDVYILSDEIHQDFTYEEHQHHPSATVADGKYRDRLLTVMAASKSFNVAGLLHSTVIIPDDQLRAAYDAYAEAHQKASLSMMGIIATEAAYAGGEEWFESLKKLTYSNYELAKGIFNEQLPEVEIADLEGTYLMFVNLNPILKGTDIITFMQDHCKIAVDYGDWFGADYKGYIRLNLATRPDIIEKAVNIICESAKKL